MTKQPPPISFRPGELAPAISARVAGETGADGQRNRNDVAQRDLARYYRLIEIEEAALDFSPAEWDALRAVLFNAHIGVNRSAVSLGMAVGDHLRLDDPGALGDAETGALLHKLFSLTPAQAMAVCDAVERWVIAQECRRDD